MTQPLVSEPAAVPRTRTDRVADATARWIDALVDHGGRNTLLFYRDLKVGTLDIARAEADPRKALLAGTPTLVTRLFPHEPLRTAALRSARAIRNRVREVDEERGIHVGHLALGMATWNDPQGRTPAAPVLLRRLDVRACGASEPDFTLHVADEVEVNAVLLHYLADELGVRVAPEDLLDPYGDLVYAPAVDRMREAAPAHVADGFTVGHRAVLGTFSYAKLPMVADLRAAGGLLAGHDVVAAIAGDPEALHAVSTRPAAVAAADDRDPAAERLVLDADASQQAVVDDVLGGRHLVVQGPPGTGKSQTIANLVASLVARGDSVLFVAEKRAALDAVVGRLERVGLDDVVLDLHDGGGGRRRVAKALADTLARAATTALPDGAMTAREVAARRHTLREHVRALHEPREPWGLSVYDAEVTLAGAPPAARTGVRLGRAALQGLDPPARELHRARVGEYADLGGLTLTGADSAWVDALVDSPDEAVRALEAVRRLRGSALPALRETMTRATVEVGLPAPHDVPGAADAAGLLSAVRNTLDAVQPQVWESPLDDLVAATAPRRWRREHGSRLGWLERRRLRRQARDLRVDAERGPDGVQLHRLLQQASLELAQWRRRSRDRRTPRTGPTLGPALEAHAAFEAELSALTTVLPAAGLAELGLSELESGLASLAREERVLARVPRLRELGRLLGEAGLGELVEELRVRGADATVAAAAYDAAVAESLRAELRLTDPRVGAFDGAAHDRAVEAFRDADVRHLAGAADLVRRAHAEHLLAARESHPDQAALVSAEAAKSRRHLPVRDLVRAAPDVLLAVRPCWAMSPLVVSQLLPAERLFDVVVFDEASQVPPGDAVPAIVRADRVVVAGDDRQLPPTTFFAALADDADAPADAVEAALAQGFESVLGVLSAALPSRGLRWHYRSRDERLIAFSNAALYGGSLTTFPGVGGGDCLRHVRVRQEIGVEGADSVAEEVRRVVELVLEHARTRPQESLGVITMGLVHADRVDGALREALRGARDVEAFFGEDVDEPFFVKNLERVQGDERDAVVLSIGYGRTAGGRLLHRFGPLNQAGGERRLNVAITRARRRMTVVSSFGAGDLEPARLRAAGARLLRDFLAYAASGGDELQLTPGRDDARLPDAVERALAARLRADGLPVAVRYGVSGRIDLAVAHPHEPGRLVLAVETDGPDYRDGGPTRDRDRLRPEQLDRLGWTHLRVWTADWADDPDGVAARVRAAWERAVAEADADDAAEAAAAAAALNPPQRVDDPREPALGDEPATNGSARGLRPRVPAGRPITGYTPRQLAELVRWIESDTLLRTQDELVRAAMAELGFRRRGPRIDAALKAAVVDARTGARAGAGAVS